MAILRLVSIFAMWGNFCGQDALCTQVGLEIPLPAGKQCAEISRYAGNSRIGGYAADINIDAKVLFQAAYQLHHAQRITAEGEEAVIGTEGDARQDFPENGADNRLDLLRGSIGWELDFLPGDSGCALLGICGITAASATVKEGQPAAFVQGMGRQCFDLTVIGAGKAAGRSKGDIPEGETEIPGCQAVDLGGNGRIIRIGSGLGTEDGMFAFRRRQGEYRDSIGGERNAFLAKQQGDITGEDIFAADNNHFLDSSGEIELSLIQNTHITGAVELARITRNDGLEAFRFLGIMPIAGTHTAALDADLADFTGFTGGAIRADGDQDHIAGRPANADNVLFSSGGGNEAAFPVGFQIDMLTAEIPAGQCTNTNTLRKSVTGSKAIQ